MAQTVIDKVVERKGKSNYTFFLPVPDTEVQKMLVTNGHRVSFKLDQDWDICLFTGGPDICPLLYGEKLMDDTCFNISRDLREVSIYRQLHHRRMKVGICRGAQLLNVMSGGRLWQHVNNHNLREGHLLKVYDSTNLLTVSSRHHQQMIPGSNGWVIGTAKQSTLLINETEGQTEIAGEPTAWDDPEIIYYGDTHSLCFQPHPEDEDDMCRGLFFETIDNLWDDGYHKEALKEW